MAAAVSMQPPMDRPFSFDQPRSRSTPPFIQRTSYDRSPSPAIHHQQPPYHHRTSSNASTSSPSPSPYNQPFPSHNYFPQVAHHQPQTAWAATAIPANSFYPSPMQLHPGQSFHQGFQQSQADFAAWATAYHQMVAASAAMGNGASSGTQYGGYSAQPEYLNEGSRRRTSSGPSASKPFSHANPEAGYSSYIHPAPSSSSAQHASHPYKRALAHRPSRENVAPTPIVVGMSRSISQPALSPTESRHSAAGSITTPTQETHRRTMSFEAGNPNASIVPPSRAASRQDSFDSNRDRSGRSTPTPTATPAVRSASPAPLTKSAPVSERPKTPQPLHTGPIANATNTPFTRPSPLSQSTAPDLEKPKSNGLKSRLRKVLDKDASTPKKQSTAPSVVRSYKPTFASPSETSTRSATPPVTPPQTNDFSPPSAPFAVTHPGAMGSDISLAETERTATAPGEINAPTGKPKRSLFRMKNMSTDNISLSSTVSSASMMIRKMGSIGKLARRNSLMGISKIFKDKPKDEDAALPEKDAKKKNKKQSKKDKAKAEASPAVVSHATAEPERISEDEDRALAGLSPAAKLARQHTLRSKAEQAKQAKENQAKTGEPAWDNNTTTRNNQHNGVLPSISSIAGPPEVLHVTPGRTSTTVRAVQVSEHEYDSEDDSSDGETIEDVTVQLAKSRLSDSSVADREFREAWGNAWIDREAVPKKGILKVTVSSENLERKAARQRSNSSAQITPTQTHSGPSPISIDHANARQIDGLTHPTPIPHHLQSGKEIDPLAAALESFDASGPSMELNFPYSTPAHNTSAPVLSLVTPGKPMAMRSMTAPARKRLVWAPECAVYSTYDPNTYDRRSEPATCNRLTPELAQMIKEELNAFKMEMPVHPDSRNHTHFFVS